MFAYLLRRLSQAVLVLVVLSVATRGLLVAMPGDPVDRLRRSSPRPLSSDDLQRLKRHYGLEDPFLVQYGKWVRQLLAGDLGYSLTYRVPVAGLLWPALGRTLILTGPAFLLAALLSVALGVRSATVAGAPDDVLVRFVCYLGVSVPPFWLCLVLVQWFAVRWRWLPPDAQTIPGMAEAYPAGTHLVLPVSAVTLLLTAEWTRYVRAGLREALGADFLRALRARGATERRILWVHAVPNALVPFFTVVGLSLPYLVGGELVAEAVFGWPGLGQLEYNAIREQDHNVATAALLLIAAATVLGSLAADLIHAALDPRVRHGVVS